METLLRRASLDQNGLPPTLEEMDAFAKDSSPQAYEKALDRLLASPISGSGWLGWLDLSLCGQQRVSGDGSRDMWLWREWLIAPTTETCP